MKRSMQQYQNMYQQPLGYYYPQQMQEYQQQPYMQQGQFPPQFYPNQEYGHMQPYSPPQAGMPGGQPGFLNPYPVPRPNQQQPSQFSGILSQFKKTNGQFDFNKMMDTTGQMMSAVNQFGSLIKGFTGFFK